MTGLNFLEAQKYVLAVLKLFGCLPYRLNPESSTVEDNKWHLLYSLSVFGVIQGFFSFNRFYIGRIENYLIDGNPTSQFVTWFEGVVVFSCYNIIMFGIFFYKKSQMKFIKMLMELEQEVNNLGMHRSDFNKTLLRTSTKFVIFYICVNVGFLGFFSFFLPDWIYANAILICESFCFSVLTTSAVIGTQFMDNIVITMGNLFDELSWILKHKITYCPFHFYHHEVTKVFELRNRLIEAIPMFSEAFGVIAFGVFFLVFGIESLEFYYAFSAVFDSEVLLSFIFSLNLAANVISFMPIFMSFSRLGFNCECVQSKVSVSIKCD